MRWLLQYLQTLKETRSKRFKKRTATACGISLRLLHALSLHVTAALGADVTTSEVVSEFVKPLTHEYGLRFVEILADSCSGERDVGQPHYFVSHAWGRPFAETVRRVLEFLSNASCFTKVWFDVVAINQHHADEAELSAFSTVIRDSHTFGTLVCLDQAGTPFSRIWCLHELDHTIQAGADKLNLLTGGETCARV